MTSGNDSLPASPEPPPGVSLAAQPQDERTMTTGSNMTLPLVHDVIAPDGSEVRTLLALAGGSMAHFLLQAGQVSRAVRHRSIDEIWYVLSGQGEMWRSHGGREVVLPLSSGTCLTIPVGNRFQFRSLGTEPLAAVAVTCRRGPATARRSWSTASGIPTVP